MNRILVTLAVLCLFPFAPALAAEEKADRTEEMKEKIIKGIDKRIQRLEEEKACISKAKKREDIRDCHAKGRDEMMEKRGGRRGRRDEMRGPRKGMDERRAPRPPMDEPELEDEDL